MVKSTGGQSDPRKGKFRGWLGAREPVFVVSAGGWLFVSIIFLILSVLGVQNPGLTGVYAVVSGGLIFVSGQSFRKESHASEIERLKAESTKAIQEVKRAQKGAEKQQSNSNNQLAAERKKHMENHAAMAVMGVFRSQTSFIEINKLSTETYEYLRINSEDTEAIRISKEALGRIAAEADGQMQQADDRIDAWRKLAPEAVDEQLKSVRARQTGRPQIVHQ